VPGCVCVCGGGGGGAIVPKGGRWSLLNLTLPYFLSGEKGAQGQGRGGRRGQFQAQEGKGAHPSSPPPFLLFSFSQSLFTSKLTPAHPCSPPPPPPPPPLPPPPPPTAEGEAGPQRQGACRGRHERGRRGRTRARPQRPPPPPPPPPSRLRLLSARGQRSRPSSRPPRPPPPPPRPRLLSARGQRSRPRSRPPRPPPPSRLRLQSACGQRSRPSSQPRGRRRRHGGRPRCPGAWQCGGEAAGDDAEPARQLVQGGKEGEEGAWKERLWGVGGGGGITSCLVDGGPLPNVTLLYFL
jgi:hypothetical protein